MHRVKTLNPRAPHCPICRISARKNGVTSAGRQRWRCPTCAHSFTIKRQSQEHAQQFRQFLDYVTDTQPKRLINNSPRTWDRSHAWCWNTRPIWQITGEVYDQVFIDGTYIAYGWCVITAATREGVIAYQLCNRESKAAYSALLHNIPAPITVVTDGDRGALAAIATCWPHTHIQRCLVHIQRNIRRITTSRPRTEQHKALYKLALDLTKITTTDQAIAWEKALAAFHQLYDTWLDEKTYKDTVPPSQIPRFARNNKKWWYTHHATRSIIKALDRHTKEGVLFTFLNPDLDTTTKLASTTNPLEGGINAPLKAFLHAHRGWSQDHMLTAIDYWLYNHSINPQPLENFATNTTTQSPTTKPQPEEGPPEIDTHINQAKPWEDGLNIQKGWIRT